MSRAETFVEDSLETETAASDETLLIRDGLQLDMGEPWMGWRFRWIVGFTFLASLFVAGVTFAAFPRIWVPDSPLAAVSQSQPPGLSQTGFTDNVSLGEIGQIMQSDRRVLQFEVTDRNGKKVTPDDAADKLKLDEILFRGNSMGLIQQRTLVVR